jgi:hypothetical protein
MIRQKTETLALAPFKAMAEALNFKYISGQGGSNRLPIQQNVYFQFGDLRVELPQCTVIIEVESAGGVTNLAKYWECIELGRVVKPIKLLHVFLQKSENDYEAHILLWRFLSTKMQQSLGSQWESRFVKSRGTSEANLAPALEIFKSWIEENAT